MELHFCVQLREKTGNGQESASGWKTPYSIILENAALLGVQFPAKLQRALEAMREKEEDPPDKDSD